MASQINDLVAMRDTDTLYELMSEEGDWMMQLDAAEGLVKLDDPRGLEFLLAAVQSDDRDAREVAREILASPRVAAMRAEREAEAERLLRGKKQAAVKRLQSGGRVFLYKMVYFPVNEILSDDPRAEGFEIPPLTEFGLDGWEVVHAIARERRLEVDVLGVNMAGTYFLLKKELSAAESDELE